MTEVVRFFSVSAVGLFVDISIAYACATMLGTPIWVAAAMGFLVAAGGNYVLHEIWTFRSGAQRLSGQRALRYLVTSIVTLLSRLAVVALLSSWIDRDHALAILIGGAAGSFVVNYTISKFLVFSKSGENKGHSL